MLKIQFEYIRYTGRIFTNQIQQHLLVHLKNIHHTTKTNGSTSFFFVIKYEQLLYIVIKLIY